MQRRRGLQRELSQHHRDPRLEKHHRRRVLSEVIEIAAQLGR
jgi:hypothetical protein